MKPLGRDRLGRLVYEGDVGTVEWQKRWIKKPAWIVEPWEDAWRYRCVVDSPGVWVKDGVSTQFL